MLTIKDYSKYPFLKGAAECLKSIPDLQKPIVKIIETDFGKNSLNVAKERLSNAIYGEKYPVKGLLPEEEIASFFFARVFISIPHPTNKFLIEKFLNYETNRFYIHYCKENRVKRQDIEKDLQITYDKTTFTLSEYIPIATRLMQSSARWKLINMPIVNGLVDISDLSKNKFDTKSDTPEILFFKERVKYKIRSTLPMKLDKETRTLLDPIAKDIFGKYYNNISNENEDYGEITPSHYPPCIQNILTILQQNGNPTHSGRFALVTFLNAIGMSENDIIAIFQTVRDYNAAQTIYQIENICGKQEGVPVYKCPACDTLKTNGICINNNNSLCSKIKHPLGYYQAKHKFSIKSSSEIKKSSCSG